jgi:type III secretion system YscD/HrpQ family protein
MRRSDADHAGFILRVLDGPSRGAEVALPAGRALAVGDAWTNDVVLRGAGSKGLRMSLAPIGDGASVTLQEGVVEILGQAVAAPATVVLPPYTPLLLGETAICCGEPASPRWREAERLLACVRDLAEPRVPQDPPAARPRSADKTISAWLNRTGRPAWIGVIAVVGALVAGEVLAFSHPSTQRIDTVPAVRRTLAQAGFQGLSVDPAPGDRILVHGFLHTDAAAARLLALVRASRLPVILAVQTDDGLVRQVEDLFRTAGVKAQARPTGPGLLTFTAAAADPGAVETLRRRALADIAGLRGLSYAGSQLDPKAGSLAPDDPGKRITAIYGGPDGFVSTADGSRYFAGAVLPSGHRIVSIESRDVIVERGDERLALSSLQPLANSQRSIP